MTRVRARIGAREALPAKALASETRTAPLERILICEKADAPVILVAKIDDFESQDDYVSLKDGDKRR